MHVTHVLMTVDATPKFGQERTIKPRNANVVDESDFDITVKTEYLSIDVQKLYKTTHDLFCNRILNDI